MRRWASGLPFYEGLEPWLVAQRVKVGIVLNPLPVPKTVLDGALEAVDPRVLEAEQGVGASDVIEDCGIFGLHPHPPLAPSSPPPLAPPPAEPPAPQPH